MLTTDRRITPNRLQEALNEGASLRILDVRTPAEFEAASIPGAYNVPLDSINIHTDQLAEVSAPLVLVCRSGQRSTQAETRLAAAGVSNVSVLEGGMNAWEKIEGAVNRGAQRWDLERQVRLVAGGLVLTGIAASTVVPRMKYLSGAIGAGLTFAALTDSCLMGQMLAKLPYNNQAPTNVQQVVAQLRNS